MINWFKKWLLLVIYSIIIISLLILNIFYIFNNGSGLDFSNIISLSVGFMALWGVIYTSIVNKDNISLQIENSNNQLKIKFNSENRLNALIGLKNLLNDILASKIVNLDDQTVFTSNSTVWFEKNRPFYLHYLPKEIRLKIKEINKKYNTEYWFSEEHFADIKSLCIYTNLKIEEMSELKGLNNMSK